MRYHNITKCDLLNGDGMRVVLWVAGCNHYCKNCQNPITWDPNGGLEFTTNEIAEIYNELQKPYISGLTLSGGDPLYPGNREQIEMLCRYFKKEFPNKTIWMYTGFLFEEVKHLPVMEYVDVLVDGPFVEEYADSQYHWAGSKGQVVWRKIVGKWVPDKTSCRILTEFPNYLIYADGRVFSLKNSKFMTQRKDKDGYLQIHIFNENPRFDQWVRVSRLVAKAFIQNYSSDKQVHHIDGNIENNCVANLLCVSNQEHGELEHDKRGWNKKPVLQYSVNGKYIARYCSSTDAGAETGICSVDISECARGVPNRKTAGGYIWKYESEDN